LPKKESDKRSLFPHLKVVMGGAVSTAPLTQFMTLSNGQESGFKYSISLLFEAHKEDCICNEKFLVRIFLRIRNSSQVYEVSALHCLSGKELRRIRLDYDILNRLYQQHLSGNSLIDEAAGTLNLDNTIENFIFNRVDVVMLPDIFLISKQVIVNSV
jgi:hypothetical protein